MICISWGLPSSRQQADCLARTRLWSSYGPCCVFVGCFLLGQNDNELGRLAYATRHNFWRRCRESDLLKRGARHILISSSGDFNAEEKYSGITQTEPFTVDLKEELKKNGYFINNTCVPLGAGEATFLRAKKSLKNWRHFQLGWTSVDPITPVKLKQQFLVRVNELLLAWLLQPLEIKYVHDTHMSQHQTQQAPCSTLLKDNKKGYFAFGSGTLKGHLLAGEERFSVKWEEDDSVWYEILSYSKPAAFLSMATYPYVQWKQKLFAKHSSSAMVKAVNDSSSGI